MIDYFAIASDGGFPKPTHTALHKMLSMATFGYFSGDTLAHYWMNEFIEDNLWFNAKLFANKMLSLIK